MKNILLVFVLTIIGATTVKAQQKLKAGDYIENIELISTADKLYSLNAQRSAQGFILVFMSNTCDYCIMYKDRIIALDEKYKPKGYPVIGISPYGDDSAKYPLDALPEMKVWVQDKKIKFPYLSDDKFKYTKMFGIEFTPEVVVLKKENKGYLVKYIGRIDDNPTLKKDKTTKMVENIINEIL